MLQSISKARLLRGLEFNRGGCLIYVRASLAMFLLLGVASGLSAYPPLASRCGNEN